VADALQRGVGAVALYLDVIVPAQIEVGEAWHRGEVSVAQEHLATEITLARMEHIRQTLPVAPASGRHAVVAAVEGEQHDVGGRMVADFLSMDGWEVDFLGADTPTLDLVSFVAGRHPDAVLLSVTLEDNLRHAARAVAHLRRLEDPPRILLGGAAIRSRADEAAALGADALTGDAWDAAQTARQLVVLPGEAPSLESLLASVGQRIREFRRARGWSQQQLAAASGLDRTYVNAVEQGKQNVTLGAVLRIASALEVSLGALLHADRQAG
jgi:methanogenic corrinoid protein MtbC1/DNA-binding XRE family transcriptional regulator